MPLVSLVGREAVIVLRTIPFWVAAAAYVVLLALFVTIWGDGVPIVGGGTNWEQFIIVQWIVLLAALPWTAARCSPPSLRDVTLFAIATAQAPSRVLLARCVALSLCLTALAFLALPLIVVMQRVAAVPLAEAAASLLPLAGLAIFVAVAATASTLVCGNRVAAWIVATACSIVLASVMPSNGTAALWLLAAALVGGPLLLRADAALTYLPERGR